jgi:hypothetical protein
MDNSNPAVKDLANQITSSENNKDVEKSLENLKESIDSLSEEIKKRGVKSAKSASDETDDNKLPFLTMLKGLSKGFMHPFTDTDILEKQLKPKQEEIPADKLKTNDIETKESMSEVATKELKQQAVEEDKPKVEKKNKTKDPELNNKLLVSISQMLNELRDNAIEKQLLAEAIKIRAILEKENTSTSPAENIVPNEQLVSNISAIPDAQGRIEPYLEEEKQKNNIPQVTVNDKIQNTPTISAGGLEPGIPENNEETKTKDRELLAQSIADKLADLLGNIGKNTGLNIPDIPNGPDRSNSKTPDKTPGKLPGKPPAGGGKIGILGGILGGLGAAAMIGNELFNTSPEDIAVLKEAENKRNNESKQNDNSLDMLKNSNILGIEDVAPSPSPMSQYKKEQPLSVETKPIQLTPKENQNAGSVLQNIFKKNEDLKSREEQTSTQQMLQPIISNQTTNNSSQTIVPSAPVPNQNTNSYLQWQKSKVTY